MNNTNKEGLYAFVKNELTKGTSEEELRQVLQNEGGWSTKDLDDVFSMHQPDSTAPMVPPPAGASPVTPSVSAEQQPPSIDSSAAGSKKKLAPVLIGVALLLVVGGAVSAFMLTGGFFTNAPYTEDDLLSGLVATSAEIDTVAYTFSGSLSVEPREADAEPFALAELEDSHERRLAYQRDGERMSAVQTLLQLLISVTDFREYPRTLEEVFLDAVAQNSHLRQVTDSVEISDPATGEPYAYRATDGGKNFELTVTFATKEAIRTVKNSYRYVATTTIVKDQTITFTKDSGSSYYFRAEPPRPRLEEYGDMLTILPPQFVAEFTLQAKTDWSDSAFADWEMSLDGEGDMGDLTYKVGADVRKTGDNYYLRIRNMPLLFGLSLGSFKNEWISIVASSTEQDGGFNPVEYYAEALPEAEEAYKEARQEIGAFLNKVLTYAEEEHLVTLDGAPTEVEVGDRSLYRYNVRVKKEAILPFVKRVQVEAEKSEVTAELGLFTDEGLVEYLESEQFSEMYDYYDKNTTLTLFVDKKGFLAEVRYDIRIVPPETAMQLRDKQLMIRLKIALNDINEPVLIEIPEGAKSLDVLMKEWEKAQYTGDSQSAKSKRDSKRTSDLSSIRYALDRYYRDHAKYPKDIYTDYSMRDVMYDKEVPNGPTGESYIYVPLGSPSNCSGYHLGVALETASHYLTNDSDSVPGTSCVTGVTDFHGNATGCEGAVPNELDECYDLHSK